MNIKHFLPLLGIALPPPSLRRGTRRHRTSQRKRQPALFPEAGHLEIPRIDNETGDIYVHYATTEQGGRLLNYALDWHADKKHSRWVAFVFTNTTATTHWNRNKWNGAYWDGQYWEGDPFQPDPDIPAGERTELADFRGSGYDRGHLCASADRLCSMDANGRTFYLSNMSPQQSNFNQDDWVKLEGQIQNWGRNSSFRDTLFVVKGGTIRDDQIKTHTRSGITVPRYYFAALLCKKIRRRAKHLQGHRILGGAQIIRGQPRPAFLGREHRRTGDAHGHRLLLQPARCRGKRRGTELRSGIMERIIVKKLPESLAVR